MNDQIRQALIAQMQSGAMDGMMQPQAPMGGAEAMQQMPPQPQPPMPAPAMAPQEPPMPPQPPAQDPMLQQQPHMGGTPDLEALKNMPPAMLQQILSQR